MSAPTIPALLGDVAEGMVAVDLDTGGYVWGWGDVRRPLDSTEVADLSVLLADALAYRTDDEKGRRYTLVALTENGRRVMGRAACGSEV